MKADEVLSSFEMLMKKKHKRRLSGAWERKAYEKEAERLRENYLFAVNYEGKNNE